MTNQAVQRVADKAQAPIEQDEALPVVQENSLLPTIMKIACDPKLDVTKLDALMQMQFKMEERQAERDFIAAFNRLAKKMPRVKKTGVIQMIDKNGVNKGSIPFAKWEEIDKVIRPLLAEEGFTLSFNSTQRQADGGGLVVTGELMHESGHSRSATIPLPLDVGPGRNNLQAMGSTLSYGKRYCAEMLLNIVREGDDDDGTKGGTRFATAEEVEELRTLIEETTTDEAKFCALFNVAHLGELPVTSVAPAKNMLLTKKGRQS